MRILIFRTFLAASVNLGNQMYSPWRMGDGAPARARLEAVALMGTRKSGSWI
jgi:hypothetical protein